MNRSCITPTGGESSTLVTLGELYVEVGDKGLHIVVPATLEVEWGVELQVLFLDSVDVHLLQQTQA